MDASRTIGRSAARPGRPDIHFYVARPPSRESLDLPRRLGSSAISAIKIF
jgi:hypothetical protein